MIPFPSRPAIAVLLSLLPGTVARAAPAPLPGLSERYALADRFLADGKLVTDLDMDARFVDGGRSVLFQRGPDGHRQVLLLSTATLATTPVTDDAALAAALAPLVKHPVAADGLHLALLDADPARGTLRFGALDHLWSRDRNGHVTPLPGTPPSYLDDPLMAPPPEATSPDGRYRIRGDGGNLVAVDTRTGRSVPLTTDGSWVQPYGRMMPPLHQILEQGTDQPKMPVLAEWSPDSRQLLSFRLDTRGVQRWSITEENAPNSRFPRGFQYVYPSAGAAVLPTVQRLLFDIPASFAAGHGVVVPVQVPPEAVLYPEPPDDRWVGDTPRIAWTERGYASLRVYDVDPRTGRAWVVARERVKPLVTVTATLMQPAPKLGGELVVSERSGWAQLYLVKPSDPDGGEALTTGDWEVTAIDHVDPATRTVLVTGTGREPGRNPYWRSLYRVRIGQAVPVLLTPENLDHDVTVSPDGRWFIDSMSSPTTPTRTLLRDATDGHVISELGHADPAALLATGFVPPQPFSAPASDGHTVLYGMIYRPVGFDPQRRYPVIDNVYAGPTTFNVPITYHQAIRSPANSLAQIGAIVVNIDGRGTSGRGQAFRLPAYRNLGRVGLDDHVDMIRAMAAKDPSFDLDRVGVWGHSAGGFDAARFILRRPDVFKVAVAGSGVHDLRLDKAWWPEVSMGDADPATWDDNSNIGLAHDLRGRLLLLHGDIDDNVPVTESFHLQKALIDAGKDVDFTLVPEKRHDLYGPYAWRQLRDFFVLYLLRELPSTDPDLGPG